MRFCQNDGNDGNDGKFIMQSFTIDQSASEQRLDRYLKKLLPLAGKGEIQRWIRTKKVKVNKSRQQANYRLQNGDEVMIFLNDGIIESYRQKKVIIAEKSGLDIVYEDDDILIVNKEVGLLVHPDKTEYKKTLSSYVKHYLSHLITPTFKPASVNRLDKNTSGLVLFAKNYTSLKLYNQKMRERQIKKTYVAIVEGCLTKEREIKGYLLKDREKNRAYFSRSSKEGAKAIHTIVRPIANKENFTKVEVDLLTGRSHQIRLSLASIGHPLIGDTKYGGQAFKGIKHQILHAEKLEFDGREFSRKSEQLEQIWSQIS